jgi:excisionase family DNA binding protein
MTILSTREVAELLQTTNDMVERLIKMGELQAERLTPRGHYRIDEEAVYAYAKRQKVTLKPAQSGGQ